MEEMSKIEKEYQKKAMSFAAYGESMHYPCYALVEEVGELMAAYDEGDETHVAGELGDVFWMLAAIHQELDIPWKKNYDLAKEDFEAFFKWQGVSFTLQEQAEHIEAIVAYTCKFSGKVAKFIRKHEGIDPKMAKDWVIKQKVLNAFRDDVAKILKDIMVRLMTVAQACKFTAPEVLEKNIAKLTERKATGTIKGSGETVVERLANAAKEVA